MVPKAQHGFVLVATLWILAIITIAAGYFAERVSRAIELAQQKKTAAEQLVEFANTRADILYRLGTTRFSFYGLGEAPAIALDDTAYRGSGDDIIRLQDNDGLLNLNFIQSQMMSNLLGQLEVPIEKHDAMIDTLRDYIDTDDLRRLNGAESAEYSALGLPLPPNDWLATPYQLKNIIGWRDYTALWENQRLLRFVTTSRLSAFNPNTAPLEVLASLPGVNQKAAEAFIALRNEKPAYSLAQLVGYAPGILEPEFFYFFPGNSIRITQQSQGLPWAVQYSLTLTPLDERAPWRIDYYVKISSNYSVENIDKVQKLPTRKLASSNGGETL